MNDSQQQKIYEYLWSVFNSERFLEYFSGALVSEATSYELLRKIHGTLSVFVPYSFFPELHRTGIEVPENLIHVLKSKFPDLTFSLDSSDELGFYVNIDKSKKIQEEIRSFISSSLRRFFERNSFKGSIDDVHKRITSVMKYTCPPHELTSFMNLKVFVHDCEVWFFSEVLFEHYNIETDKERN